MYKCSDGVLFIVYKIWEWPVGDQQSSIPQQDKVYKVC